jgi:hypothetical protein
MEFSLMWWNPRPKCTNCVILMPSLISIPQSELAPLDPQQSQQQSQQGDDEG